MSKLYPVLPIKEQIPFPGHTMPILVGRQKSKASLKASEEQNLPIILIPQKNLSDAPQAEDLFEVGVLAFVEKRMNVADGSVKVVISTKQRVKVTSFKIEKSIIQAEYELPSESMTRGPSLEALIRQIKSKFEIFAAFVPSEVSVELGRQVTAIEDASELVDTVAPFLSRLKLAEKYLILEQFDVNKRAAHLLDFLTSEVEIMRVEKQISKKVKANFEKVHKVTYLNEQLRQIKSELSNEEAVGYGGLMDDKEDFSDLETALKEKLMPEKIQQSIQKQLKRLKKTPTHVAEMSQIRTYLEWMIALPWENYSEVHFDYDQAKRELDDKHYGMEKVKERVIEYLAVQKLRGFTKGSVICFTGSPGTGKSSLAESIAKATGREFVKASLGGVRDEAEIRGHRRTYVGSMPGKIVASFKKCKYGNPVFLLDEVDKMGKDHGRGDVASALLEVLDTEQNKAFVDHYLDVEYDLSKTMFILTANDIGGIPHALRDRLEIIEVPSYTPDEKFNIAKQHLVPKQLKENGLPSGQVSMDDGVLRDIVRFWTNESGVRNLERQLAKIFRKQAVELIRESKHGDVTKETLEKYLGPKKYEKAVYKRVDQIGVAMGLAYTSTGGTVLPIEIATVPGKGEIILTGQMGKVMSESAKMAFSCVQNLLKDVIKPEAVKDYNFHIHLPEGAIPKEGPSAGVALGSVLYSILMDEKIRSDVAMTGELTLRGLVLPIGGLKEKLTAAFLGGIKKVVIPEGNKNDLIDLQKTELSSLDVVCVETFSQALEHIIIPK